MKLMQGDRIDELELPSTNGNTFNIEAISGKKALLTFYRFATCPFCNLRIFEMNQRYAELGTDFKIIAVFDSDIDFLIKNMKKHDTPFIILADKNFEYFKKYDVEQSVWKFLVGSTVGFFRLCRGLLKGYIPLIMKGSMRTVPVDILINEDGTIQKVCYGKHTSDHLDFEEIKEFAQNRH